MSLAKMFGVIAIGMPLTLLSTAQVAFLVRKYVQTEMLDAPTADALPPFGKMHFITWGEISSAYAIFFHIRVLPVPSPLEFLSWNSPSTWGDLATLNVSTFAS